MRISILFTFALIVFSFQLLAQSDSSSISKFKPIYFNNFLAGGLLGKSEQGSALSLSTTHGVRFNRLAVGAGIGFDSYLRWKTLSVFGSLSFDFARIKKNAFFIQFNMGSADAARIDNAQMGEADYHFSGGKILGSNIGYRINASKFSLYISVGHKFQRIHYSYDLPGSKISIDENTNRMAVQIGFGLH